MCSYNLHFLFRKRDYKKEFLLKKKTSQTITLRSPKHFNIGKNKIINVNYKAVNLYYRKASPIYLTSLIDSGKYLFSVLEKNIANSTVLRVNSISINIKTKFKLMWLEI